MRFLLEGQSRAFEKPTAKTQLYGASCGNDWSVSLLQWRFAFCYLADADERKHTYELQNANGTKQL